MRTKRTKNPKPLLSMTLHPRGSWPISLFSFFHSCRRNNQHFLTSWTESEHLCKSIITDIKWYWWHLEIPYESLTDSGTQVAQGQIFKVKFNHIFKSFPHSKNLSYDSSFTDLTAMEWWLYLNSTQPQNICFMDHLFLPCSQANVPFHLFKAWNKVKTSCTFRLLFTIDSFLWH